MFDWKGDARTLDAIFNAQDAMNKEITSVQERRELGLLPECLTCMDVGFVEVDCACGDVRRVKCECQLER